MKTADIISLHPGKQHNLEQAEQLIKYYDSFTHVTSFAVSQEKLQKLNFLPRFVLTEMNKRSIPPRLANHVDLFPWYEFLYKMKRFLNKGLAYDEFFLKRNRYFQRKFLKQYKAPRIFIGFDNGSELIFEKWKGKSTLILDLTIAIPQYKKKLAQEYNLPPSTFENLTKLDDVWYKTYEKELDLADFILCGSQFVKDSCLYYGVPAEKLIVIPYGANMQKFTPRIMPENRNETPFKIAFVGNVSYRKGADVLLKAWEQFSKKYPQAELHFFGNLQIDTSGFSLNNVHFHGFITQDELIRHLNECHVSILPTFFEGSSYAIYQSMALGLAVVTTPNCGSVVTNMKNGIIINYGSDSEICSALSLLIEQKDLRLKLAHNAMEDVKSYTWENYGRQLQKFLATI